MASIGVGRSLSQWVKRSRVAPVAAWIFQRSVYLRNHEAGSGRPTPTETMTMRFYNQPHRFYAGGDLHARSLYLHILDDQGQTRFDQNLPANPEAFLQAVAPFRDGLVVGVECMFAWYWLADLCEDQGIPFLLGHALYMKAIHGGKTKNDKIDAAKIATLLRGGLFRQAYVYHWLSWPAGWLAPPDCRWLASRRFSRRLCRR